jgi:hypothetical protein
MAATGLLLAFISVKGKAIQVEGGPDFRGRM